MKFLLAHDGSEAALGTEDFLINITDSTRAIAEIVSVIYPPHYGTFGYESMFIAAEMHESMRKEAALALENSTTKFNEANWQQSSHLVEGVPAQEILANSKALNADVIAVGSQRKSGFEKFLLGSVSSKIVRHAECTVLIHRGSTQPAGEKLRILLAYDGSDDSKKAVEFLKSYPWKSAIEVLIVRVIELVEAFNMDAIQHSSAGWDDEVQASQQSIESVKDELEATAASVETQLHQSQKVAEELLQTSDVWKPDLIVIGHQGHGAVAQFLLGSVAYRVAEHAPCSVIIVR
ncbi:MAG TPA: hypothetical protein DIW81_19195 [Planctomycetaceae bacterium]|nr:hypothetical protein [Planctomycetaceae bacterium]